MLVALTAFVLSLLNASLTSCACGHMGWISFPGNVVGLVAAWYAFCAGKDNRLAARVVIDLAVPAVTLIILKNIGDLLW